MFHCLFHIQAYQLEIEKLTLNMTGYDTTYKNGNNMTDEQIQAFSLDCARLKIATWDLEKLLGGKFSQLFGLLEGGCVRMRVVQEAPRYQGSSLQSTDHT